MFWYVHDNRGSSPIYTFSYIGEFPIILKRCTTNLPYDIIILENKNNLNFKEKQS